MGTVTYLQDPYRPEDEDAGDSTPVGPGWTSSTFNPKVIDFGHYAGRTIEEIAETDPPFLYWLARHPSGARYRTEIARVLADRRAPVEY
jgi:hypothetical protein